jgi:hypothetical protein
LRIRKNQITKRFANLRQVEDHILRYNYASPNSHLVCIKSEDKPSKLHKGLPIKAVFELKRGKATK